MTSDAALAPPETAALDRALDELTAAADQWRRLALAAKRDLLRECGRRVGDHATEWVAAACLGRGVSPEALIAGEEWVSGPWVTLAYTNALAETVGALARGDDPLRGVRLRANGRVGQTVVDVLPHDAFDRVLMSGFRVEVWMEPGATVDRVLETAGAGLTRGGGGGVALVLGAGNITSIAPLDVLYKLYAGNQVVILKPSPVVAAMTPVLGRVLAPFIERGFVRIAAGGAEVGRYLTEHPKVGSVHMTGSRDTHDAIVFGPGEEGARRKAQGRPRLTKPVTGELGGVSPTIVLPGRWKDADLRFQAEHVASQKLGNGGFTCVASQVLVLPRAWPQADRFLEHLDQVFATANSCPAYYPGADRRQEHVLAGHRSARRYQGLRALVPDLSPDDPLLTTEVFGPVLGVVRLPGTDASTFLGEAVSFANDVVPGTLAANLIGDPASLKALGPELDHVISRLRFGCVGVNAWTAVAYLTPRAPWGGFPGARLDDVQSGLGIVHNALLLDAPQRSVVYGPFRPAPRSLLGGEPSLSPKPPWFITNRTARKTGQLLTRFAADPSWRHVPPIVVSAMRG